MSATGKIKYVDLWEIARNVELDFPTVFNEEIVLVCKTEFSTWEVKFDSVEDAVTHIGYTRKQFPQASFRILRRVVSDTVLETHDAEGKT